MKPQRIRTVRSFVLTSLAAGMLCGAADAGLPATELLQRLPPGVNSIAAIDVDALLKSERAQKEKWKSKRDVNYGSRPLMVPPEARTVVVAAQLRPSEDLRQDWEVALIDLSTTFPITDAYHSLRPSAG